MYHQTINSGDQHYRLMQEKVTYSGAYLIESLSKDQSWEPMSSPGRHLEQFSDLPSRRRPCRRCWPRKKGHVCFPSWWQSSDSRKKKTQVCFPSSRSSGSRIDCEMTMSECRVKKPLTPIQFQISFYAKYACTRAWSVTNMWFVVCQIQIPRRQTSLSHSKTEREINKMTKAYLDFLIY